MIRPCRTLNLLSLAILTAILAVSAPAPAAVPQTIAFQGFLTDAGGQPLEVPVNLDIAVYNTASGGTALWTEAHTGVPVSKGVFAVALGSVSPLSGAVARTSPRFVGIRVNGEAELPRTELRATPFALRALAADTVTTGINISQGTCPSLSSRYSTQGEMNLDVGIRNSTGDSRQAGGRLHRQGDPGTSSTRTAPPASVGLQQLHRRAALWPSTAMTDRLDRTRRGLLTIPMRFPVGGINAVESFNEPGLAAANNTGTVALTATVASVLSRTITPPEDGYVLALGQCVARINHTNGTGTSGAIGLSDDGVAFGTAQDVNLQISANAGSGSYSLPAHLNGVFPATAGVPLTIHLVGSEASGVIDIEDTSLTLLYVPTAYGSVSQTLLAASDGEDLPARGAQTPGELLAEKLASQEANTARLEQELATMRSEYAERLANIEDRLEQAGGQR
jgi:hypothetical protein